MQLRHFVAPIAALFAILWSVMATADQIRRDDPASRVAVDVSKLGPQVGERVPDFRLKDHTGKTWTLESVMGPNGAMLVFYRSADW